MTNIQPQTRVFDPKGNETFVTRQSENTNHFRPARKHNLPWIVADNPHRYPPGHSRQSRAQSMTASTQVSSFPYSNPEHWL